MQKYAIILAGGQGLRMQSAIAKQFIEIDGKPILVHTIERFFQFDQSIQIILVLPTNLWPEWKGIQEVFLTKQKITLALGGKTRSESVRAGLASITEDGLVAIHDGVRPFVSIDTIENSFNSAEKNGSGVVTIKLKDSIREINSQGSSSRDRQDYRLVQTPQTFRVSEIKQAYNKIRADDFSDDASLYEAAGFEVNMVDGTYENIKITTPEDLK